MSTVSANALPSLTLLYEVSVSVTMTAVTKVAPRMASALPVCTQPFYRGNILLA